MIRNGLLIRGLNSRLVIRNIAPASVGHLVYGFQAKRTYALFDSLPKRDAKTINDIEPQVQETSKPNDIETTESSSRLFNDSPITENPIKSATEGGAINWGDSFHGLGGAPFSKEISDILLSPLKTEDIEIKPDGLLYLPEIKYRRILNRAFGPGGWGLAPRTESYITPKQISREYALICHGRLVSVARGEQDYFGGEEKIATALEGCKSNALMRCCKDLGIASELWDPSFIKTWKQKNCDEVFGEHVVTKRKKKLWKLKRNKTLDYPYQKV